MPTRQSFDTVVKDLSPDSRTRAVAEMGKRLGITTKKRQEQLNALQRLLAPEQQKMLRELLDSYGLETALRQAINDMMALTNHEHALLQPLIGQINSYRTQLGLPPELDNKIFGSIKWAHSRRAFTTTEIRDRIHRELTILREQEIRERKKAIVQETSEAIPRRRDRFSLLEHFRRRLKLRYGIELSPRVIELIDEDARLRPTMEVSSKGSKLKLLEINGQSVWAVVTRSVEGQLVLTTVLTYEMVARQAYARGDSIPIHQSE
jgi:hypothetical protein